MAESFRSATTKKKKKDEKVIRIPEKTAQSIGTKKGHGADLSKYNNDDLVFALDIGTRMVKGIVGIQDNDKFRIIAAEFTEHKSRSMFDGQIHEISQVIEAVKTVKEKLEKKLGFSITRVAVAAAGRALKTSRAKVEKDVEQSREIDQELVSSLEIEALQKAQTNLDNEVLRQEKTQYYCVGYSVISYYLNGFVISNLLGHRGTKIGAEVLATFLPQIVIDSLYTVVNRVGLEIMSITLEPIAAINAAIPKDLRLLNLALVDIGAGTSDIAITKDGSVIAYAMIPVAGDEITESISEHYMVDFKTAERMKLSLSLNTEDIKFTDILGKNRVVKPNEMLETVKPVLQSLSLSISDKIKQFNQKAPNAVFMVGGGSQVPGFAAEIARCLGIPEERVVVKGREIIKNIRFSGKKLFGPECVTPIGIAITAQMDKYKNTFSLKVDGKTVRLFNSKRITVADALVLSGYNAGQLIGRSGKSVTFLLNGEKKTVRGEYGKAAEIYINGKQASLDTFVNASDEIKVIPAEDGKDAEVTAEYIARIYGTTKITFNGRVIEVSPKVYINNKTASPGQKIHENDVVQVEKIASIGELMYMQGMDPLEFTIYVNGREENINYLFNSSDLVECLPKRNESIKDNPPIKDIGHKKDSKFEITVNGKKISLNGEKEYIFIDIFNYISFDVTKAKGNIILRLNGKQAAFTDVIKPGDIIDIYWE